MEVPNYNSLTLAPYRIPFVKFLSLLKSKASPAVAEAQLIYDTFIMTGVDPSFALAQFRVESQYGTAGFAKETGSWGNMLWDSSLCLNATGKVTKDTAAGQYTYATYTNYVKACTDYAHYLHNYAEVRKLPTIYGATAEWIGKVPGSAGHLNYVNTVLQDMVEYQFKDGQFYEVGDKMIYGGLPFDRTTGHIVQKYPVTKGMNLYRGTDGTILKQYAGATSVPNDIKSYAWYLGLVQGSTDWGVICIGTSSADADATWVYIKNPDVSKIINV